MNFDLNTLTFLALGYALGSVPFAILVSRAFGLADPRTVGSGNPGATNVLRSGNKKAAILTLIGDALKGLVAMLIAGQLGADMLGVTLAGFGAFFGHVFSVFLKFKGGKGVATAAGVFFGFSVWLGLIVLAVWLATALISRYSSLGAIAASIAAPFAAWWLLPHPEQAIAVTLIAVIVIRRHRENIQRLIAGTEGKMGKKG
ncbi:MAG TPA: glycerol-3-phosphate 1-O-acyltransferase PlsY [Rhodocyclaceae bacterium]|nr:glycerol-3-phosphate 1-O-acyltransferase PlsY [Rhodocyclaceae bacterium]